MKCIDKKNWIFWVVLVIFLIGEVIDKGSISLKIVISSIIGALLLAEAIRLYRFLKYYNSNVLEYGEEAESFYYNQPDIVKKIEQTKNESGVLVTVILFGAVLVSAVLGWLLIYLTKDVDESLSIFISDIHIIITLALVYTVLLITRKIYEKRNDYIRYAVENSQK